MAQYNAHIGRIQLKTGPYMCCIICMITCNTNQIAHATGFIYIFSKVADNSSTQSCLMYLYITTVVPSLAVIIAAIVQPLPLSPEPLLDIVVPRLHYHLNIKIRTVFNKRRPCGPSVLIQIPVADWYQNFIRNNNVAWSFLRIIFSTLFRI